MMTILFVIPARGGSKGLLKKNIRPLNGKPLIAYTLEAALAVAKPVDICVSTDSPEIKSVVESYGITVPFMRPPELSTDHASSESAVKHALNYYSEHGRKFDFVAMLQATSPLRNGRHLQDALDLIDSDTEMIVSVKETSANPYYVLYEEDCKGFLQMSKEAHFDRRQDCPVVYELNGAIYIMRVDALMVKGMKKLKRKKFLMDQLHSIDIDTYLDFGIAELAMKGDLGQ